MKQDIYSLVVNGVQYYIKGKKLLESDTILSYQQAGAYPVEIHIYDTLEELEAAIKENKLQNAISKLSEEERKLLGVKVEVK